MARWQPSSRRLGQILSFCAEDPVERVFLEDVARRGLGRFSAVAANGRLTALCHVGANVVPSGAGLRRVRARGGRQPGADGDRRGERGRRALGRSALEDADAARGPPGPAGLRDRAGAGAGRDRAARGDAGRSAAARPGLRGGATRRRSGSTRSSAIRTAFAGGRRPRSARAVRGSGSRTGRSSSRRRRPRGRRRRYSSSRSGSTRRCATAATRSAGCATSAGGCSREVPRVCLFVRPENAPAIRVYESVGMQRTISYRSLIF